MGTGPPRVTVSLVTYNGMDWLPGCLASVLAQDVPDYELVILDNASTDGSRAWLEQQAAADDRIRLIQSPENLGFARAHNRIIARARGAFVLLLNQDVELDPGFLGHAVAAFTDRPHVAAVQGRLRRLGPGAVRMQTLDSTGLEMHRDRRFVSRSQGEQDSELHRRPGPVFGADGPAPVYRRTALLDARLPVHGSWEVLDEDFFMYKEDVDLAWRLRRLGWSAWYAPDALAWHGRGAGGARTLTLREIVRTNRSLPRRVRLLSWRNHRLMLVKNESLPSLARDLPWIVRREALSLGYMAVADPGSLRAVVDLVRLLPGAMRKRRSLAQRAQGRPDGPSDGAAGWVTPQAPR